MLAVLQRRGGSIDIAPPLGQSPGTVSRTPTRGYTPALDLTGTDFDAHRKARATRQREALRTRLAAWGHRVAPRLSVFGIEVDVEVREEEAADVLRLRPRGDDASFTLSVAAKGVEVGLELGPVRIENGVAESHLLASLESLPEPFCVRLHGGEEVAPGDTDLAMLAAGRTWIGWNVPRAVAIEHSELLDDQLEDSIAALGGVLAVVSPRARLAVPAARVSAPRLTSGVSRRPQTTSLLDRGSRVQVLHGPFAGKIGVVRDVDGAVAHIVLGLLAARIATKDLAAVVARRTLGSSHRRPTPRRS
jgi:hypothetical protein